MPKQVEGVFLLSTLIHRKKQLHGQRCARSIETSYRLSGALNFYIIRFVAIASCLYVQLGIRSDVFTLAPAGSGLTNGAVALSRPIGIPALMWPGLWLIVSSGLSVFFPKRAACVNSK